MKVLWLASWYPNKYEPVNGDFIQRHVKAVAKFLPIHLIHVVQLGKNAKINDEVERHKQDNLTEEIHYINYQEKKFGFIDKVLYNRFYAKKYLKILERYFEENGKPDLIHVHVPMKAGWIAMKIKEKYHIPYIVSEHGSYYDEAAPDTFAKRSFFFKKTTAKVCKNANLVTNVSTLIGNKMKNLFNLQKVETIHNVVDCNVFYHVPKSIKNEFIWIHVSTLGEQKNIEDLLASFALFYQQQKQPQKLMMVGPYQDYHIQLAKRLDIEDAVIFTGEVEHIKVAQLMQQAHAFVLFSKHENFPCVIIEALCCGLPVISSNVGGLAEAITEQNGLIVQSENREQLITAYHQIFKNYAQYNALQIAKNAKEKYDNDVIGKKFIKLYTQITNEHFL